ncbi:radical SAM/SPASM domain-containing protein [Acidianus sp. RZ1]|uniref:radical SAM/SPASM domain-containing protein n=1 Tax=Acidianus sp. RZ1 TaxID=1540082 RepID=UPI0014913401|nr:radical SAM/SPASM domain-containing protein [Acidianus sp. RZ1]NON62382.1 radical SAM protein [Acidianus sp. RZ1]
MIEVYLLDDEDVWFYNDLKLVEKIGDKYKVYLNPFKVEKIVQLEDVLKPHMFLNISRTYVRHDPLKAFLIWQFEGIVLELTYKCNFTCEHCYVNSSPKRKEVMKLEIAKSVLEQCFYLPYIEKRVHFTGGEVSLIWESFLEIAKYAKNLGYSISFATNGVWALNENKIDEIKRIGFNDIEFSITPYHIKFWKKEKLVKAITNMKKSGLSFYIRWLSDMDHSLDELFNDFHEIIRGIKVISSPVLRIGRGRNINGFKDFPTGSCFNFLNLTVTPNGDLYPCCNGSETTALGRLGNVKDGVENVLSTSRTSTLRALTLLGPGFFYKKLGIKLKDYVSICEMCNDILNDESTYAEIRKFLRKQK